MSKAKQRNITYSSETGIDLHEKIKKGDKFILVCNLTDRKDWRGRKLPDIKSSTLEHGKLYIVEERWNFTDGQVKYKIKGSDKFYHSSKFRQLTSDEKKQLMRNEKIKRVLG